MCKETISLMNFPQNECDVLPGLPRNAGLGTCDVQLAVDTRLVAAVQRGAGARCHESANLLQAYYFCVQEYQRAARERDVVGLVELWTILQDAKAQMRSFLTKQFFADAVR